MQNLKAGEGDSKSVSISGKDKNMGRWTRDEKQKFIDGKFDYDFSQKIIH